MSNILLKTKSGIPAQQLKLALTEATKCGWGFNAKKGYLRLPNYNTISGDVDEDYGLYIANGAVVIAPIATVEATIDGFCTNAIVSATGVTITGCLASTPLANLATRQLTATVQPTGSVQTGTWTSSNPTVATVSSTGLVTATATDGTTAITFTSTDGGYTATCLITVA